MALYNYSALDSSGNRTSGNVDARSKSAAVALLKERGLYVLSIDEARNSIMDAFAELRGVPFSDVVSFTRQLSTMISAGLSVSKSLDVLANQTTNTTFRNVLTTILRDVEGGAPLASAFGKHPDVFSTTYQALVQAGEASGKLDQILDRLADTMEAERELRAKFKSAMIYPTIIFIAMIGIFFLLMVVVIPQLSDMYDSLNVQLPIVTRILIAISDFMVNNILVIIVGGIGGVYGLLKFMKSKTGRALKIFLSFHTPVFGKINNKKELTEFTTTLGLLISSAVPIVDSLHIVADVVSSSTYRAGAMQAAMHIEKGGTLSSYLKADENFPPILGNMVATGEETGKLDEVLERLGKFFANETEHLVDGLTAALEPFILIMLGGMVGFLIISIITPIYQITQAL